MKKRLVVLFSFVSVMALCLTAIFSVNCLSENSWANKAPMPTPRASMGVAVVSENIYVIGGTDMQTFVSANEQYDPATNTWLERAPMPTPRANLAVAVYEGKIYAMGGKVAGSEAGCSEITYVNEVYDPATNAWNRKAPIPVVPSYSFAASVIDGKIYLITGVQIQVYDPATDTWANKTVLPTSVANFACAVVEGKVYVISGAADGIPVGLTQVYDPKADQWSFGASIPAAIVNAAAGIVTDTSSSPVIYVLGGQAPTDPLHAQNFTQAYFVKNNSWVEGVSMPIRRASLGVAVVDNVLYAIGGGSGLFSPTSSDNIQYIPSEHGLSERFYQSPTPSFFTSLSPLPSQSPIPVQSTAPTLSPTPSAADSPSITPSSSNYTTQQPTLSHTLTPTLTIYSTPQDHTTLYIIIGVITLAIITIAGVIVYFKKG